MLLEPWVLPDFLAMSERGVEHASRPEVTAPRHQQVRRCASISNAVVRNTIEREQRVNAGAIVPGESIQLVGDGETWREVRNGGVRWIVDADVRGSNCAVGEEFAAEHRQVLGRVV